MAIELTDRDVLLVIDVQNDFCDGGALPVPGGQEVVPVIHRIAPAFSHVILTQDWHPQDHHSFASNHPGRTPFETKETGHGEQVLWPDHCVQGSLGAAFHPHLLLDNTELILRKGFRKSIDSYSAFTENDRLTPTGLTGYLRERGLGRIFLTGLAYDFCVRHSAIDGMRAGFETYVVEDACRAIDLRDSVAATDHVFHEAGVHRIHSAMLEPA
ncbi:MAG: bifunctional nicotinamidase/pyrazinamidase [Acidobacteriaceae bacterium]|jgi:nicotinamidase/pyrazinamidase